MFQTKALVATKEELTQKFRAKTIYDKMIPKVIIMDGYGGYLKGYLPPELEEYPTIQQIYSTPSHQLPNIVDLYMKNEYNITHLRPTTNSITQPVTKFTEENSFYLCHRCFYHTHLKSRMMRHYRNGGTCVVKYVNCLGLSDEEYMIVSTCKRFFSNTIVPKKIPAYLCIQFAKFYRDVLNYISIPEIEEYYYKKEEDPNWNYDDGVLDDPNIDWENIQPWW